MTIHGVVEALAPSGRLRCTINYGNPILACRDADTGVTKGVSVALAELLAARLQVPLELVVLESAGKAVAAVEQGRADFGFFARDPVRANLIAFTAPYILIEGCYLTRKESPIQRTEDVDSAGTRVVVGKGSAYDLYLSREIAYATIERAPTSPTVVEHFLATNAGVAAGVRQQLEKDAARLPGLRLLPGRFMVIEQAMGVARSRGSVAERYLEEFVEGVKAEGIVADLLKRNEIGDVTVAPAA